MVRKPNPNGLMSWPDDFLLRQLMLEGPLDAGDTDSTVRVLEFSNFDTPVAIARPAT